MNSNMSKIPVSRGFTLIELLVVVLIIAVLAAVALPQYQKAVWKSKMAQNVAIFNTLAKSIDMYLLENGYPATGMVWFTGAQSNRDRLIASPAWKRCNNNLGCYFREDDQGWSSLCESTGCYIYLWDTELLACPGYLYGTLGFYRTSSNPTWRFGTTSTGKTEGVCRFIRDFYGADKMDEGLKTYCTGQGIV